MKTIRVNNFTSLGSFAPVLNQTQRKSIGLKNVRFEKRIPEEGEAKPITFNTVGQPWAHHSMEPSRSGSSNHLQIKSRGF